MAKYKFYHKDDNSKIVFEGDSLVGAYLYEANLRGANLRGANLEGANLSFTKGIISFCGG